jgi:uncharacterized membrane protein
MSRSSQGGLTHRLFKVGVVFKAIDAVFELIGGVAMFFVSPHQTERLIRLLLDNQLFGNASNPLVHHMVHALRHLSTDTKLFAAIYLLAHGVVKLVLVTGLILKWQWAYLAAMTAFVLFLAYQIYRYTHTGSIGLLVLSGLDVFVIVMTVLEYRRLHHQHEFA